MANRLIIGSHAGTYVIRISRPGFNVLDESLRPEQIAFDSRSFEQGVILQSGTIYCPPQQTYAGQTTVSIPDQGFIPSILFTASEITEGDLQWMRDTPYIERHRISFFNYGNSTKIYTYAVLRQSNG